MSITVLQWNVWLFEKKENLLELIREVNPDIVCLQELTTGSTFQDGINIAEYLAEELSFNHFHKIMPNLAPSDGVGNLANGIFSRFPIVATDWHWVQEPVNGGKTYDDQYRLYVEASLKINDDIVQVGTVHMSYTHKFVENSQRRAESDKLLELVSAKTKKFILTGDFNATPGSYLLDRLEKQLRHAGPDYAEKTWTTKPFSYNGFDEDKLNWRLDYTFTTRDLSVRSSKVVRTDYSDHLPILTTLAVN